MIVIIPTEWFLEIFAKWQSWAILVSLLISIFIALLGVVPSIFVTSANVLFFGIYNGLIISWLGEIIGAGLSFKLYRWGFKKRAENISLKYPLINKLTQAQGFDISLIIFQARLLPYVPSGLVTLAGAVSKMSLMPFMLATALGKLPSVTLEVLISYKLLQINKVLLITIFTIAFIITIIVTMKKNEH